MRTLGFDQQKGPAFDYRQWTISAGKIWGFQREKSDDFSYNKLGFQLETSGFQAENIWTNQKQSHPSAPGVLVTSHGAASAAEAEASGAPALMEMEVIEPD
jgi:hypothetical protein